MNKITLGKQQQEELEKFKNFSEEEQHWITDEGDLIVDDYYLNDIGEITKIIYE